ncbi:alpha/beta fold hydrolase [Emcibacter nanhaiensis]|uniref:Alpha/beta hydrolase n=1 Tax=Emcibacter nanhaiensis TaxID=1505037 RepID=A0A501PF12_9PROT|nr:alpha/beta hydrolase [Emcibacter nanhaiensis]TPD59010.1 alpha/beta hydrolase [Emcibacter nanhaiensis]
MNADTPTLILIPGLLSDDIVWEHAAEKLGSLVPVRIADVSGGISMTKMAQEILDKNPGPLYVAGHSMGARVAVEMARLAPDRIRKLALIDTGVHPRKEGEEAKRQVLVDLAYNEGMEALAARWLPPMVHEDRHSDKDLMGALTAMVLRADPEQHERQIKALLDRPDATITLPHIKCPVLLAVGRQDQWSPLSQHEEMLTYLDNAKLVVIEDAGHFAPIERPEQVTKALEEWITT